MVHYGLGTPEELAVFSGDRIETIRVALHRAQRAGHVFHGKARLFELSYSRYTLTDRGRQRLELEDTRLSDALIVQAFRGRRSVAGAPVFRCDCSVWLGQVEKGQACPTCRGHFEQVRPKGWA